ncbi:MAG: DUF255 domain-containing protein [Opitutaceae bacterium]|nr:DUF255 domain-containing protein [Opitutaceae bacterium]
MSVPGCRPLLACILAGSAPAFSAEVNWAPPAASIWSKAAETGRPVFLHVGSQSSALAQAMQEQTFAREESADFLNSRFLCVLVNAETDPVATEQARALALQLSQPAVLPFNLWLTPDGRPIEVHGYLPPSSEWGRESFLTVAQRVSDQWIRDRGSVLAASAAAVESFSTPGPAPAPDTTVVGNTLEEAAQATLATLAADGTTFGEPPHPLEPELWRFLLQRNGPAREAALSVLDHLSRSPMKDPQGTFRRRAAEPGWSSPSADTLLSDQVRLAWAFLGAASLTGDARWRQETVQLLKALRHFARDDGFLFQGWMAMDASQPARRIPSARLVDNAMAACVLIEAGKRFEETDLLNEGRALARLLSQALAEPTTLLPTGAPATARDLVWLAAAQHSASLDPAPTLASLADRFDPAQARWLASSRTAASWWPLVVPLPTSAACDDSSTELALLLAPGTPPDLRSLARNSLTRALADSAAPTGLALLALSLP